MKVLIDVGNTNIVLITPMIAFVLVIFFIKEVLYKRSLLFLL